MKSHIEQVAKRVVFFLESEYRSVGHPLKSMYTSEAVNAEMKPQHE